jgi:SEC-C motif-containing protein
MPATITATSPCPCSSGRAYGECCEPHLSGRTQPATAEALMRARYTAYAVGQVDYVEKTDDPASRERFDRNAAEAWSSKSEWLGLEVIAKEAGEAGDQEGVVEFSARFKLAGKEHAHRERSRFKRIEGKWHYIDGEKPAQKPFVASEPALGRNDPCHCGSGKKFKKCHGG